MLSQVCLPETRSAFPHLRPALREYQTRTTTMTTLRLTHHSYLHISLGKHHLVLCSIHPILRSSYFARTSFPNRCDMAPAHYLRKCVLEVFQQMEETLWKGKLQVHGTTLKGTLLIMMYNEQKMRYSKRSVSFSTHLVYFHCELKSDFCCTGGLYFPKSFVSDTLFKSTWSECT